MFGSYTENWEGDLANFTMTGSNWTLDLGNIWFGDKSINNATTYTEAKIATGSPYIYVPENDWDYFSSIVSSTNNGLTCDSS